MFCRFRIKSHYETNKRTDGRTGKTGDEAYYDGRVIKYAEKWKQQFNGRTAINTHTRRQSFIT